jgi:quercetin dioxygenase-like cupin family protein
MDPGEKSGTALYRMSPGSRYSRHRHPEGEECLVLKGDVSFGEQKLKAGDFLYSPPGSVHEMTTVTGAMVLISVTKAVEIIPASFLEDVELPAEGAPPLSSG